MARVERKLRLEEHGQSPGNQPPVRKVPRATHDGLKGPSIRSAGDPSNTLSPTAMAPDRGSSKRNLIFQVPFQEGNPFPRFAARPPNWSGSRSPEAEGHRTCRPQRPRAQQRPRCSPGDPKPAVANCLLGCGAKLWGGGGIVSDPFLDGFNRRRGNHFGGVPDLRNTHMVREMQGMKNGMSPRKTIQLVVSFKGTKAWVHSHILNQHKHLTQTNPTDRAFFPFALRGEHGWTPRPKKIRCFLLVSLSTNPF